MRIFIVEDEAIVAMHLAMLVAELGHEVCAIVASAAVARAVTLRPDAVLMDIRLARGSIVIDQLESFIDAEHYAASFSAQTWTSRREQRCCPVIPSTLLESPFCPYCCSEPCKRPKV
jgi:DNA-binding NarL/FixJ family response regulator